MFSVIILAFPLRSDGITWSSCTTKPTSVLEPSPTNHTYPSTDGWLQANDLHASQVTLYMRLNDGEAQIVYVSASGTASNAIQSPKIGKFV